MFLTQQGTRMFMKIFQVSMTHPLMTNRRPAFTSLQDDKDTDDKEITSSLPRAQKFYVNGSFLL